MIIKSLSRKGKTGHFRQLYDYIAREAHGDALWHNFLYSEPDRERTVRTFEDNAKHIRKSPRHNILYHEVISLKRLSKDLEELQIEALRDIGRQYLNARAGTQLGYGAIHTNQKDSIHLHLMISSNGVDSNRRVRIPKFEFTQIQKDIETTLQQEYPALCEKTIYNKPWEKNKKETHKEQQLKRGRASPRKKKYSKKNSWRLFIKPAPKMKQSAF